MRRTVPSDLLFSYLTRLGMGHRPYLTRSFFVNGAYVAVGRGQLPSVGGASRTAGSLAKVINLSTHPASTVCNTSLPNSLKL